MKIEREAVSEEAGSLSPSGFKGEAKGLNWIFNCMGSQKGLGCTVACSVTFIRCSMFILIGHKEGIRKHSY